VEGVNRHRCRGRAVQVDPIRPKLKPPGIKRLKLETDGLLSNFGFKFSLRRYTGEGFEDDDDDDIEAGADTRPLSSST